MRYLVTGAAGFIGSHVSDALLRHGHEVVGIDNLDPYYSPERKKANLREVEATANASSGTFRFVERDIRDREGIEHLFESHGFDCVVHLAAMAGVRNSIDHPDIYYAVNFDGTRNLLDVLVSSGDAEQRQFIFASTSSVYGATTRLPFDESDPCDKPMVPYSASKRAAELVGHTYHHLHGLNFTTLRFFTVYGPRGRPDMMAYKILDSIRSGAEVRLNNGGEMYRDWTYVDDVVAGIIAAADRPLGYEIFNLGRGEPVRLGDFVSLIEEKAGGKAKLRDGPIPQGDVAATHADIAKARSLLGYEPVVSVTDGVGAFIDWYKTAVLL